MGSQVVSLRVLAAYAQDVGRGIVRMDSRSMDILDVANGDLVEIIGDNEGTDARCYQLLPSDEDKGIARIDPALRKIIGVTVDNSVTIRKMAGRGVLSE
ncbi:MAG: AAA family ATPase, partial [Thermoproteota archaeon]|nr:AAA family ATPase [Thermoproteota archaeon]